MIEVLKQALEALEKVKRRAVVMGSTGDYREGQLDALKEVSEDVKPAIASLRQAIAELESQEPVAWRTCVEGIWFTAGKKAVLHKELVSINSNAEIEPLYILPPQRTWQGLTDEEIEEIRESTYQEFIEIIRSTGRGKREPKTFVRAIEAKLKEKNA